MAVLGATGIAVLATLFLPITVRLVGVELLALGLTALTVALLARRLRAKTSTRNSLGLLALSLLLHGFLALGKLLAIQGVPWLDPASKLSFCLDLLVPLLLGAAVFAWPSSDRNLVARWRECLDAVLFTTSLFLVFWLLGLGDLFSAAPLAFGLKLRELTFFLNYALLMGLALYRSLDSPEGFASPLGWLLCAFSMAAFGNLAYIALYLRGSYFPGHPMDGLSLFILSCYLLAALTPIRGRSEQDMVLPGPRIGSLFLPYLPFLMAVPLIVVRWPSLGRMQDVVAIWLGLGMLGLLMLRQLVALWDSQVLSRNLEAQVRQRTLALEESQSMLLRTQRMNILATLGAGLAHDLNNLLSVVTMSTDLLAEDLKEGQTPSPKDLSTLRSASTQAGELVKKLMAFGRRGESRPQVFDMRERLKETAKLLEKLAGSHVKVTWIFGGEPLMLHMDPIQIEQILVNLVANARDAMPQGGTLRIQADLDRGAEVPKARLSLTDSGTGIPSENLERLFSAFFTTKEPGKGTGLGLASVKAIADECGATIAVESHLGVGTTFTLHFNVASLEP